MKKNLFICVITLFLASNVFAFEENKEDPFIIDSYSITQDTINNQYMIIFEIRSRVPGIYTSYLHLPDESKLITGSITSDSTYIDSTQSVTLSWVLDDMNDWNYAVEVFSHIRFYNPIHDSIYSKSGCHYLFYKITNGILISQSQMPDTTSIQYITTEIDSLYLVDNLDPSAKKDDQTQNNYIYVNITGKLTYDDNANYYCLRRDGIPGYYVNLGFDAVYYGNGTISYRPVPRNGDPLRHVHYDITNMDGSFSFSFRLDGGGRPLNYFFNTIDLIVFTQSEVQLPRGYSINLTARTTYDLSSTTYNLNLTNFNGQSTFIPSNAYRYIYRAKKFTEDYFQHQPGTGYFRIASSDRSYYSSSEGNIYLSPNYQPPLTVYHEYGHEIHDDINGLLSGNCPGSGHWFDRYTNVACAWSEGWATFFSAACAAYWYRQEMSTEIEPDNIYYVNPGTPYNVYQFFDLSQAHLPSGNRESIEGAISTFLYSLVDNYSLRAPGYTGDNDDIRFPPNLILSAQSAALSYYWYWQYSSPVRGLKEYLIDNMYSSNWSQRDYIINSLNSLYDAIIIDDGIARSATPTYLDVVGSTDSRFLTWNDNTCPDDIEYTYKCYSWPEDYDLDENQELGFNIYRKAVTSNNWDGSLNGYTLIGSTIANVTSWSDNSVLAPGMYSYVVVAFNNEGISIPSAEKTVDCSSLSKPENIVFENHVTSSFEFYGANTTITAGSPYTFLVNSGGDLTFCAGDNIQLNPGFTAVSGSKFLAKIDNCESCQGVEQQTNVVVSTTKIEEAVNNDKGTMEIIVVPNPVQTQCNIQLSNPEGDVLNLLLFDIYGNKINLISNQFFDRGSFNITYDASNLTSGVYYLSLSSSKMTATSKFILLK